MHSQKIVRHSSLGLALAAFVAGPLATLTMWGNSTPQTLPFTQNWSTTTLITANDDWSLVPGIEGFLGDDATTTANPRDPSVVLTNFSTIDVIAQALPNNTAGGVAEMDTLADPCVALQGSGGADNPFLLIHLDTTGKQNILFACNLRDVDNTTDNSVQPVSIQYRVGNSGNFTALDLTADTTTGPSVATLVTARSIPLPGAANNQSLVQIRIMTANAAGNDEWVGIDDISVTGDSFVAAGVTEIYWDANGATAGIGGTGTWDYPSITWNTNINGITYPTNFSSGMLAIFAGTPGVVSVDAGNINATNGIRFDVDGYTIQNNFLTNGSAQPITVTTAGHTATINSTITGAFGLKKAGDGTLVLGSSANDFAGNIAVNAGTLSISSDAQLGNTANDIVLTSGGTLKTAAILTMGSGRDLTGSGVLDAPATLTVNGTVNVGSLALVNVGGIDMISSPSVTIGTLTLSNAATLMVATLTNSGITVAQTTGTALVLANTIQFGSANRTLNVNDGSAADDLQLDAVLSGTTQQIKVGAGTLFVTGDNSAGFSSFRHGLSGTAPAIGGTLRVTSGKALGTNAYQFNSGKLLASAPLTGANALPANLALSIGAGQTGNGAEFAGSAIEINGPVALFKPTGTNIAHRITVNNNTTLFGTFGPSAGSSTSLGLTIAGTGSLTLSNTGNLITESITVTQATLRVFGTLAASSVTVSNGGSLAGNGQLFYQVTVNSGGTISPGASPGTLGTGNVTLAGGGTNIWQMNNATGTEGVDPGWDLMNVTGALNLTANPGNKFNLDITSLTLGNAPGNAANFNNAVSQSWTNLKTTAGITGFDPAAFNLLTNNFSNPLAGGRFAITTNVGNNLVLQFFRAPVTNVVVNNNDTGAGSLRDTILASESGDTIQFAPGLSGATILLTSGQLSLTKNLTIDASALANGIAIDGNTNGRIFQVNGGNTVVVDSLTITHGKVTGDGGGIHNAGTLSVNRCTLVGNVASQWGGGIVNYGTLTVNQSTLTTNSCQSNGGAGIDVESGSVTVNQSTVTGNSTPDSGGCGGVWGGGIVLSNSIVAGNTAPTFANIFGTITATGVNLTNGVPLLAPLGNYGGPTPTMPPLAGSPAIDGCTNGIDPSFTTDQRGLPRVLDGNGDGIAVADIGAVESAAAPLLVIALNGANPFTNECHFAFNDPGATNSAGFGVTVSGSLDTNTPGTYTLTYTGTNSYGVSASTNRTVVVNDSLSPVVTMLGDNPLTITQNAPFVDPGAVNFDSCANGSVTMVTNNTVNAAVAGFYTNTYTATDSSGNSAISSRVVIVTQPNSIWSYSQIGPFTTNGLGQSPLISLSGSTGIRTTNYVGTGATTYSSVNAPTNAGTYYVSNTVASDANYSGAANSQAFAIYDSFVLVSFSVDLNVEKQQGRFADGDLVAVRGTFNGYITGYLTENPVSSGIYTGTFADSTDALAGQLRYKFWNSSSNALNGGWESTANGQDRTVLLPANNGDSLVLPKAFFADGGDPTNYTVTFQVDMAPQIALGTFDPNTQTVEVRGNFNSWSGGNTLTHEPAILRTNAMGLVTSNAYVGTFATTTPSSPGQIDNYKFVIQPGDQYEQLSGVRVDGTGNRFFTHIDVTNPVVYFGEVTFGNLVTFQVDLSAQAFAGRFDPFFDFVELRGSFNGWNGGLTMSNTPAPGNPYIYSILYPLGDVGGITNHGYKFYVYGLNNLNYEHPVSTSGGNRSVSLLSQTNQQTLPLVYFSDIATNEILTLPTLVTFTVDMANAVGIDNHVFTIGDVVYLNGDFLGWWPWGQTPAAYALTNVPGTTNYSITLPVANGNPLQLVYKYSINGADNELTYLQNHVRFIRQTGNYSLPTDVWGVPVVETLILTTTNPPVLTSLAKLGNGAFQFSFTNQASTSFTVFASTNVAWPINAWSNLGSAVETPASSGQYHFTDPQATNHPQRYYRVRSP